MNGLNERNVLILGLGISGLAMARWCARQGARVTVADTREAPPQLAVLREQLPQVAFLAGAFDEALLARGDWQLIGRSPGLLPTQLADVRAWAQVRGVPLVGELDLFALALHDLGMRERLAYRPKVLAITGTNGKTTVTSLTTQLLRRCGLNVAVAGNIGPALLDVLAEALDAEAAAEQVEAEQAAVEQAEAGEGDAPAVPVAAEAAAPETATAVVGAVAVVDAAEAAGAETEPGAAPGDVPADTPTDTDTDTDTDAAAETEEDGESPTLLVPPPVAPQPPPHLPAVWVLELSSFQLDGVAGGAWDAVPTAATVLNITEDHLDWHGSMAAYAQAKAAVHGSGALMLLNRDDPQVMASQPAMVTVKVSGRNRQQPARPWASFGFDVPTRSGDWGIDTTNGMAWLVRAQLLDETARRGRGPVDEEIYLQRLMPVDALRIRGRHNAANALAALALACSTGAPLAPMLHGLREYRGEPHRVEPVAIVNGVEYFDDSKGTNVGATLAAIRGLGAERRLVVILGGVGKGQDFAPLAEPLARHARAVVLIGRDAPQIRGQVAEAAAAAGLPLLDAASLADAVALGAEQAHAGDAVLMSPACASFDMFRDYEHRAQAFVAAVAELAAEQGVDLEGGL